MMLHAPAMFLRLRLVTVRMTGLGPLAAALLAFLRKTPPRQKVTTAPSTSPWMWTAPPPSKPS